jgi:hypothetical protein
MPKAGAAKCGDRRARSWYPELRVARVCLAKSEVNSGVCPIRPPHAGAVARGGQYRSHSAEPHDAGFRFTVMATGLLPTLALSDPHRDPHRAGRGRIPLDQSASIRLPVSSGWTSTDVRGQPYHELEMRYPG